MVYMDIISYRFSDSFFFFPQTLTLFPAHFLQQFVSHITLTYCHMNACFTRRRLICIRIYTELISPFGCSIFIPLIWYSWLIKVIEFQPISLCGVTVSDYFLYDSMLKFRVLLLFYAFQRLFPSFFSGQIEKIHLTFESLFLLFKPRHDFTRFTIRTTIRTPMYMN